MSQWKVWRVVAVLLVLSSFGLVGVAAADPAEQGSAVESSWSAGLSWFGWVADLWGALESLILPSDPAVTTTPNEDPLDPEQDPDHGAAVDPLG